MQQMSGTLLDLILYLALVALGAFLGSRPQIQSLPMPWLGRFQTAALLLLIVTLGAELGANEEIISSLGTIGLNALAVTLTSMVGSMLAVHALRKYLLKLNAQGRSCQEAPEDSDPGSGEAVHVDHSLTFAIVFTVAAGILAGEDVAKHLEGCTAALLLAVTLGPGVDVQIRRAGVGDIAAGVASDALGSALAEQAADAAEAELRQWAAEQDKYLTGRFSPGYGDWPITVQPKVAAVLDTARRAGICVLNTNLMTPRKSVTAILGVSDHPVKGHLAGCGHCVLRTRCEYRKRGKTCASE